MRLLPLLFTLLFASWVPAEEIPKADEEFIRAHPPRTEDGVILDPGLDMFRDAAWNLRGKGGPGR